MHDRDTSTAGTADTSLPPELADISPDRIVNVDVREDLRAGREPFTRIMEAQRDLPEGGVLRLRAIFDPVPLYRVMASHGLVHWTEELGPEDWRVWFYPARSPSGGEEDTGAGASDSSASDSAEPDSAERVLDVRGLEPPEPMVRTLEALEDLPPGGVLRQVNVRVPRFLLPRLEERGFTWEVEEKAGDEVHVRIRRAPSES